MRLLTVNLKHLYQRRGCWFLGLVFGGSAFVVVSAIERATRAVGNDKLGGFCAPSMWLLLFAPFIAALAIEVLTKPFSYCLPGHRGVLRTFLFWVGLPLSFLWGLSFLFYPGLSVAEAMPFCLSAFATFTIFYWIGVWIVFRFKNWQFVFALFPLMMLGDAPLNVSAFIVHHIVASPLSMILLGAAVNYFAWSTLGRSDLARRYCGRLWLGAFDAWNREKVIKVRLAQVKEKDKKNPNYCRVSEGVENIFLSRMGRAGVGSLPQYIWGGLYKTFGMMISQYRREWMRMFVIFVPLLSFLCYMPGGGKNIVFFMPGLMIAYMNLWVHSSLLVSGGRRERFWSGLVLAVTAGALITIVVTMITLCMQLLEGTMPPLPYSGHTFTFEAPSLHLCIIPFLMIPVVLSISLVFYKKPLLTMFLTILVFQVFFVLNVVQNLKILGWAVQIGFLGVSIALLCSWAAFVGVLRYITLRCCLVKQSG